MVDGFQVDRSYAENSDPFIHVIIRVGRGFKIDGWWFWRWSVLRWKLWSRLSWLPGHFLLILNQLCHYKNKTFKDGFISPFLCNCVINTKTNKPDLGASLHSEDHQALKLFGPPGFHMFDCNGRDKYWPFYINCTVITTSWDCNIYCLYAILMAMTMQWNGMVTFLRISLVRVPSKSPPLPPTSIPHLRHFPHSLHLLYYFVLHNIEEN